MLWIYFLFCVEETTPNTELQSNSKLWFKVLLTWLHKNKYFSLLAAEEKKECLFPCAEGKVRLMIVNKFLSIWKKKTDQITFSESFVMLQQPHTVSKWQACFLIQIMILFGIVRHDWWGFGHHGIQAPRYFAHIFYLQVYSYMNLNWKCLHLQIVYR